MNKTVQIIVDSVLGVAVIALFVLFFAGKKPAVTPVAAPAEGAMPVAYVNLDSVLAGYTFAIEASEKLMNKQEDARAKFNAKMRTFQGEYADFQRKLENNAFLSRERAESEANRLQRKQQELEELEQKLTQELAIENQNLNIQLADSLNSFLKAYNADGRFGIIFSNMGKDNILMSDAAYDITADIVAGMNERYAGKAKK